VTADGSRAEWLEEKHAQLNGPLPEPVVSPKRIQLSRRKGYRKPPDAVTVTRPTVWGNPWKIGDTGWTVLPGGLRDKSPHPPLTREQAIESFRNSITFDPDYVAFIREQLGGRDLACYCALDVPCHADVLLEIANGEPS
jgi:hypothetical protein